MTDSPKTDATRLREYLARAGLGQREAARLLDVPMRQMRSYCAGDPVPRVVMIAAEHLAHCKMPQGARASECPDCGGTYGTHREECPREPEAADGYDAARSERLEKRKQS